MQCKDTTNFGFHKEKNLIFYISTNNCYLLSINTGGLSGPCVKPVALRMVWQVAKAVKIPVVGLGGISSATDAIEFLMAGATAIEIGTANFLDPAITIKVRDGINQWLDDHGCQDVHEIIGCI